ncbi:cytochrome P450 2A9-like isoform X2 [Dermacentor albipictus]|uniref:cytochrome P450 2A9-like isoform X2 n=1 Tax=Dermacentor albipictus TaxID=60249 RepID=UPI0031FD187F
MENGSHTGHLEVILTSLLTVGTGIATLALVAFLWSRYRCKNTGRIPLPPGPRGVPLLGYLPFLRGQQHKAFRDIADKYGPVFRIKLGAMNVVVLNDFESISEGYSKLLGRPKALFLDHAGLKGLANLNGRPWVENRRFCVRSITSGSYGGKTMDQQIADEAVYLARKISDTKGAAINAGELVLPSVSNNVTALVLGARYDFEDKRRTFLDGLLVKAMRCLAAGAVVTVMPIGLRAIATLFFTKLGQIRRIAEDLQTFFSQEVVSGQASGRQENSISFIEDYKQMIANEKGNANSCFKDEFLLGNILTLFGAGSQTTYQTVVWHLLNLADKVDTVQRRIRHEVDLVVGRNRPPRWEDRHDMPYTMASIWELYRWRTPALLGVPRQAEEDVVVGQYLIPAGTVVISNIWAAHMDPERWTDPEQFKPERFLTDEGSVLIEKPQNLIAFSIGKRMCPAEPLANAQVFVYIALMVQRFVILPEEGKSIDLSFDSDGLCVPRLQHLRFMER